MIFQQSVKLMGIIIIIIIFISIISISHSLQPLSDKLLYSVLS